MTEFEITALRLRLAGYDMAKARKDISIIITGTKLGNLDLSYSKVTKKYFVSNANTGKLLHEGDAGSTKIFVAQQYVVNVIS